MHWKKLSAFILKQYSIILLDSGILFSILCTLTLTLYFVIFSIAYLNKKLFLFLKKICTN